MENSQSNIIIVRPVNVEDAIHINELRLQPQVLNYTTSLPSEQIDYNRKYLENLSRNDHVFVAEVEGKVVGMVGLHVKDGRLRHVGDIGLMVHDAHAGKGIGRQLLAKVLNLADNDLGLMRVELEVYADNTRALHLYESMGFEQEGLKRKAVFRNGNHHDIIVMGRVH